MSADSGRKEAARPAGNEAEATTRLAAGMAHDFNDILQAVIGGLDLVMDEVEADTPARKFAGMALTAAIEGSRLTRDLMAYAGNQMLCPRPIPVADFLANMKIMLSRTLHPCVTVDLRVTDAPLAFADPGALQTVLRDIAVNAAQAMPSGGTLRIEARLEVTAGVGCVVIAMTDTGTGMDAATLARATEPFFTTRGGRGAGLGLAMAKGFAEQSGGTLRIASAPGCGTVVTVRLPAAASADRLLAMKDTGDAGIHRPLRRYG